MTEKRIGIIDGFLEDAAVTTSVVTKQGDIVVALATTETEALNLLDSIANDEVKVDALLIESDISPESIDGESAQKIVDRIDELGISPFLIANTTLGVTEDIYDNFQAHAIKTKLGYFEDLEEAIARI